MSTRRGSRAGSGGTPCRRCRTSTSRAPCPRPWRRRRTEAATGPVTLTVDAGADLGELPRPWRPMIGSEHLSHAISTDTTGGRVIGEELSAALRAAHEELGVTHVRAHAILCDDLGVYREVDGQPVHDFSGVDKVYDHIRSLGLYPVVEVSYMPHDLASDPTKTVFDYRAIISPPKDWQRWHDLVRDLTAHLVERYGDEVVEHWSFEVWNEANLEVFWSGTPARLPQAVRRHGGRRARRRRAAGRRGTLLGRGRLGRGAPRPRGTLRGPGRLHLDPHLRCPAARLPPDAGEVRPDRNADLVDRVGRDAHALQRGQRRGVLRGVPAPRDVLVDGPDRVAVVLGGVRPLRGARPAAGLAARRLRPAHGRGAAQAPLVGAGDAGAARGEAARGLAGR